MPIKLGLLEWVFFTAMLLAGVGTAWLVSRDPSLNDAALPPIVWPIGAAFAFDLASVALKGGGMPPLAMPLRAIGVVGAMVLVALLQGRI
jgi:hypothetical protein